MIRMLVFIAVICVAYGIVCEYAKWRDEERKRKSDDWFNSDFDSKERP